MIIGLSGKAGSGKDTIADYLVTNYGYTKFALADAVREAVFILNPSLGGQPEQTIQDIVSSLG